MWLKTQVDDNNENKQRWSRGHEARSQDQGHKKKTRPRTALPRTDPLEAKDRNARGQGPRTQGQVFSEKKRSSKIFFGRSQKKSLQKFFQAFSNKKRLLKFFFQAIYKISTIQKKNAVLEPRTGQFLRTWGFEAKDLTFEAKDFKMCPLGHPRGQGRSRGLHFWQQVYEKFTQNAKLKESSTNIRVK